LENLSVIIPSHERQKLLNDSTDYWIKAGIKNIIVLDSSKIFNEYVNENIRSYTHLPNVGFIDKFKHSIDQITTDYVLICADDDYASVNCIKKCLEFLNDDLSFVAAHGHYCDFQFYKDSKNIKWQPKTTYISPSLDQDDNFDRLGIHLNYYTPTLYSVMRKKTMVDSYYSLLEYKNKVKEEYTPLYEIYWSSQQVLSGKIKRLDELFSIRQYLPNSAGNLTQQYSNIYLKDNFSNCYKFFKEYIINNLSSSDGYSKKENEFNFYFNNFYKARLNLSTEKLFPKEKYENSTKEFKKNKDSKIFNFLKRFILIIKAIYLSITVQNKLKIHVPKMWWLRVFQHYFDIKNISKHL
jgi:glycosyltransferase domain-containing protein